MRCSERVVDLLEAVEVDHHDREGGIGPGRRGERVLDAVVEEAAVGEAGQRVVHRLMFDLLDLAAQERLAHVERLLGLVARGDVDHVPLRVLRRPGLVVHDHRGVVDPHDAAVAGDQAVLVVERLDAPVSLHEGLQYPVVIVGVKQLAEEVGIGHPFLGGVADQIGDLRADVDGACGIQALDVGGEGELLDQRPVAGLGLVAGMLCAMALGDVPADADHAIGPAVCVREHAAHHTAPLEAALAEGAKLHLERPAFGGRAGEGVDHPVAVVRVHELAERFEGAAEAAGLEAVQRLHLGREAGLAGVEVPLEAAHAGAPHRQLELGDALRRPPPPRAPGARPPRQRAGG